VLLTVAVAAPAAAATVAPLVTASDHVTGREPLRLTLAGITDAVTVTTTSMSGAVAQWSLPAPEDVAVGPVDIDLTAPDVGEPPLNGAVALAVSVADTVVLQSNFLLDATAPAPTLYGRGRTATAVLRWDPVVANGPVTYQLARDNGDGWTTVASRLAETAFIDRDLAGDYYRYRLTAVVPSAGGGQNLSEPDDVVLRVTSAAPAPAPTESATPAPKPEANRRRVQRPRAVAATGSIRGPVSPRQERRDKAAARAAVRAHPEQEALVPKMRGGMDLRWDGSPQPPAVAAPRPPAPATPRVIPPDPALPVLVPPAGMLAVDVGQAARTQPFAVAGGLLLLTSLGLGMTLASGRVSLRRRRIAVPAEATEQ
jgi:hypothetical protein